MTRILALVTDAFGGRGGIAQAARDVIGAFGASDTVKFVDVLPRRVAEAPRNVPAKVRQLSPSEGKLAYAARAFLTAARSKPDLVFCNHLYMAPLASLVAWHASAKLIIQLHGIETWEQPSRAQRAALERAHTILCVSRDTRARALSHCNLVPERAVVLNNTVDPHFTPGDRLAARRKFGLGDEFVMLTVGRLDARESYKGHDRVIKALSNLRQQGGRQIVYLIAGGGDDRARLEVEAKTSGVAERVLFLGQVSAGDLPDLYRAADLFALPSTGEGFGIVFLEAMACGTPAIGLAVGGAPDALGDGDLGACPAPEAFEEALLALFAAGQLRDPSLPVRVRERFGHERFSSVLAARLKSLITSGVSPRLSIWS